MRRERTKPIVFLFSKRETTMGSGRDGRSAKLNQLYLVVVFAIVAAGLTHWIFGVPSNHDFKSYAWLYMLICGVGLLNELGFFGRD